MRLILATLIASVTLTSSVFAAAETLRFAADDWWTECGAALPASDCSLTAVFSGTDSRGVMGSFAIVVALEGLLVAVVGHPAPAKATLRVDKFPAMQCAGSRYCLFADADSAKLVSELAVGALVLIDVYTAKYTFRASLSTKGYQAGLAKIRSAQR